MYRVVTDEQIQQQIDDLPRDALTGLAELRTVLEVNPWAGEPINDSNPEGSVRTMIFGRDHNGVAAYLILDDQRRVDLLQITWFG